MFAGQQLSGQPCIATQTIDAGDAVVVLDGAGTLNAAYTTEYVLVDLATGLVAAVKATGDFTADVVAGGSYQIHVLNYDSADAPDPAVAVGALGVPVNVGPFRSALDEIAAEIATYSASISEPLIILFTSPVTKPSFSVKFVAFV